MDTKKEGGIDLESVKGAAFLKIQEEFTSMQQAMSKINTKVLTAISTFSDTGRTELMAIRDQLQLKISAQIQESLQMVEKRLHAVEGNWARTSSTLTARIQILDVPNVTFSQSTQNSPSRSLAQADQRQELFHMPMTTAEVPSVAQEREKEDSTDEDDDLGPVSSLSELEPQLAAAVRAHIPANLSGQERLSPLQYGYFHLQMKRFKITDFKGLQRKAQQILEQGVKDRIWSKNWIPPNTKHPLLQFLIEKLKSTLKKKKRLSESTGESAGPQPCKKQRGDGGDAPA